MSGDKTEQPTPKRLRDARKKGQVAKSKEVVSAAVIIGLFMYLWAGSGYIIEHLSQMVLLPSSLYGMEFHDALAALVQGVVNKVILVVLPLVMASMVLAMLANFFQIGVLFAFEPVKADIKKINPMQGVKKIFSKDNLIELLKSAIKITFLGLLIYKVIRASIDPLLHLPHLGIHGVLPLLGALLKKVVAYTIAAFGIVAAADYFWQKHSHIKKLMMTKDEVKREYKEMEGDPTIRVRESNYTRRW